MSKLCRCFCSILLLIISVTVIGVGIVLYNDFPNLFGDRVKSQMIIEEDTNGYNHWYNPETIETTKFFLFNIENPKEYLVGKKIRVKEYGPYVFRVLRIKANIEYSTDKTIVSYTEKKAFYYDSIMSNGFLDDNITTTNIAIASLNSFLTQLAKSNNVLTVRNSNFTASQIFDIFRSNIFVTKSVRDILFGRNDDSEVSRIVQLSQSLANLGIPKPKPLPKTFKLFRNYSENKYDVLTGKGVNPEMYYEIVKWNDLATLSYWNGRSCNTINGTDGHQFYPFIQKRNILYEFSPDICRSVYLVYDREKEVYNIPVYRFVPSKKAFYGPTSNVANKCFCLSPQAPEKCNFDGILDMSSCFSGAPLVLSNPHFRRASTVVAQNVAGLSALEDLHKSFVDIEPISGSVINRARRYQINAHIKKSPLAVNLDQYLKESVVPVVWYEELSHITDDQINEIKIQYVWPSKYEEIAIMSLIGFGLFLFIMSVCCCCCCCCCSGSKNKIDPISSEAIKTLENKSKTKAVVESVPTHNDKPLSHNYDEIFKGQTPLERLKLNPTKKQRNVTNTSQPTTQSLPPPPPPPPPPFPPPPPPPPSFNFNGPSIIESDIMSNVKDLSGGDSRHQLLQQISDPRSEYNKSVPQSYYRWFNNQLSNYHSEEQNNSTLGNRAKFNVISPEPPKFSPSQQQQVSLNQKSEMIQVESFDSNDRYESDFSDNELDKTESNDESNQISFERQKPQQIVLITNCHNKLNMIDIQTKIGHQNNALITDIYHFVNKT